MAVDKRAALLDAAERAILAQGYAGASTRRIAREADVPLSLLHYYFGGKGGLLIALVERARDRNRAAVQVQIGGPGPALQRAGAALKTARDTFLADADSMRLLLEMAVAALHNPRLHAEVERLYVDTFQALSRTAADLLDETGLGARVRARPEAVASLILAAGFGLALQRTLGVEPRLTDEAFDTFGRLLLATVGTPSATTE